MTKKVSKKAGQILIFLVLVSISGFNSLAQNDQFNFSIPVEFNNISSDFSKFRINVTLRRVNAGLEKVEKKEFNLTNGSYKGTVRIGLNVTDPSRVLTWSIELEFMRARTRGWEKARDNFCSPGRACSHKTEGAYRISDSGRF